MNDDKFNALVRYIESKQVVFLTHAEEAFFGSKKHAQDYWGCLVISYADVLKHAAALAAANFEGIKDA